MGNVENTVMEAIYSLCDGKLSCLVSRDDILRSSSKKNKKKNISAKKLEDTLALLQMDGFFDVIYSERKGERMYVITLHTKGLAFRRNKKKAKKRALFKVLVTVLCAVASFLIGLFLKAVFHT